MLCALVSLPSQLRNARTSQPAAPPGFSDGAGRVLQVVGHVVSPSLSVSPYRLTLNKAYLPGMPHEVGAIGKVFDTVRVVGVHAQQRHKPEWGELLPRH